MIIIGYPGVGKSESSKQFVEVIDLESSIVSRDNGFKIVDEPLECYCHIAEYLSKQGYVVCVSSHSEVQKYFLKSTEQVYICFPELDLRDSWVYHLRQRYLQDPNEKNYKALDRVVSHFEDDIEEMKHSGFDKIELPEGVFLTNVLFDSIKHQQELQEEQVTPEVTPDFFEELEPEFESTEVTDGTENTEQE